MARPNGYLTEMRRRQSVRISDGKEPRILYYILFIIIVVLVMQWFIYHEPAVQTRPAALLESDYSSLYSEIYHHRIRLLLHQAMNRSSQSFINTRNISYELCEEVPDLIGEMSNNETSNRNSTSCGACNKTLDDVFRQNPDIKPGGSWRPRDCIARHQVAFIIPYRDRYDNLVALLDALLPTLKRQKTHFQIYLVEQNGSLTFNKGILMNAGYIEALKERQWHCFTFHDVDLIPDDDRNMYTCPSQPRHMSVLIDKMDYRLPYEELVGGVFILKTEHFQKVNGYSNMYWGWGAEDDDMYKRLMASGFRVDRPSYRVSKYKMESHKQRASAPWKIRYGLLHTSLKRFRTDGVNSVKYNLVFKKKEPLFTHLMIDVGKPPLMNKV